MGEVSRRLRVCLLALLAAAVPGCRREAVPKMQGATENSPRAKAPTTPARPDEFSARVMKVVDGDTVRVVDRDFQSVLVQLNGVDSPELPQAFGKEARDTLAKRLDEKVVRIVVSNRDELDRIAGEMFDGEQSINVWMIERGYGWYNHKYDKDDAKSVAEVAAREAGRGLWAEPNPVPPWVWKNPPDDGQLYVQGNGRKYHRASCPTLDGRRKAITLADALKTHEPCQRCKPPTE